MFMLSEDDLAATILGCADGPASFNAEATRRGARVISCDPLYRLTKAQIQERIAATYDVVLEQTRRNAETFVWDTIRSVDELGLVRMASMQRFLEDYEAGLAARRYIAAELPVLPFEDASAGLALCANFLFLYAEQRDESFHLAAIQELCRVAREVRIFPLLDLSGGRSPHIDPVTDALRTGGYGVSIEKVPYEFQRGGNQMMRIRRR
jgi:hypothetical protein